MNTARRRFASVCLVASLTATAARGSAIGVDDCVDMALARSPALQAATDEARATQGEADAAAAAYFPKLAAIAQYGRSEGYDEAVTNGGQTQLGVGIDMPLLDGGLRRARLGAAEARLRSSEEMARQRRADVALAVRAAYLTALAARAEEAAQSEAVEALGGSLTLLRRLEERGMTTHDEVLRAKLALATAESATRSARSTLESELRELEILVGTELEPAALADPADAPLAPPADAEVDASPLLADARAALEAARRDADAARSEKRAQLSLTATAGFLGVRPERTFPDDGGGEFLLGFTLPLFDGGQSAARIASAAARASAAEAKVEEARRTLRSSLSRLRIESERAWREMESWRRAIPEAKESFELLRARYAGGGNVRLLEVLDALARLVDARLTRIHAQLAHRLAAASQADLLGETAP